MNVGLRKQRIMMAWTSVVAANGQTEEMFCRRAEALPPRLDSFPRDRMSCVDGISPICGENQLLPHRMELGGLPGRGVKGGC